MAKQHQVNIRLDLPDLAKLDEIVNYINSHKYSSGLDLERNCNKWYFTRQDAIIALIRAFEIPTGKR